jgi:hypothetical protein
VNRSSISTLDFGDRQPGLLVIDPALGIAPLPTSSLIDAFFPIVVDATLALATICTRAGARPWIVSDDPAVAAQLTSRTNARVVGPTDPEAWIGDVTGSDVVILVGHKTVPPSLAALAARGTRLLRPGLATSIAARIATLLDLEERMSRGFNGELVDPIFVPTARQVVVDDPSCPTTLVGGGNDEQRRMAATARAKTLLRGRGRL